MTVRVVFGQVVVRYTGTLLEHLEIFFNLGTLGLEHRVHAPDVTMVVPGLAQGHLS